MKAKVDTTRPGLRILVQLADLGRAMSCLSRSHWEVVLLCGLLGLPQEVAAPLIGIRQQTLSDRYQHAVEELTIHINNWRTN